MEAHSSDIEQGKEEIKDLRERERKMYLLIGLTGKWECAVQ